jgi:hypothetical protein
MPTHVGPNISGEENLVFGFDLSDQKNSYLGEPTTNYFASFGIAMPNLSGGNVTTTLPDGTTGMVFRVTVNSNSNTSRCSMGINLSNQIPQANVSYTVSHWIRTTTSVPVAAGWEAEVGSPDGYVRPSFESGYIGNYGSFVQPNTISSTWQRVTYTYSYNTTKTSNITPFIYFGSPIGGTQDTIGATIDFYGFQFEVNSHSTPYTTTSRSATQGLLDLTKNNTINISGTSFNSTAQMTFDGTNDIISIPTNSIFNTNIFSVESVFKLSTYDNEHRTIASRNASVYSHSNGWWMGTLRNGLGNGNNDFRMFFWGDSSYVTYSTSNGGNDGRHHHMVISSNGITVFFYVDGQLIYSASKPSGNLYLSSENILIGQSPVGDNWSGEIPVVKFYNRELSSSEVLNNYNNIKRKYGI